jgi:hypothetical protein
MFRAPSSPPSNRHPVEKRSRKRFPLNLTVEYRVLTGPMRAGSGITRNISSCGVLFEPFKSEFLAGPIELTVCWPCLLDDIRPLKLVMKGRIVRAHDGAFAVRSMQHEFRTAGTLGRLPSVSPNSKFGL